MAKEFINSKIKISPQQILFLNNQLASMVRLDLSLPLGFKSLAKEVQDPDFQHLIQIIEKDLSQGVPLMEAFQKFPKAFSPLYLQILKAGESTGNLATVLQQLSKYSSTMHRIKNRIRDAISYPLFVLFASSVLLFYMLIIAIPQFKKLILVRGKNATIPTMTKIVFTLSDIVRNPYYSIPGGIIAFLLFLWIIGKLRQAGEEFAEYLFKIPLFGNLFRQATLLKVCRTMSDLLKNGVSMVEALSLASNVAGKNKIQEALVNMQKAVENGERMSSKLQEASVFPETMIWKLQMAEERGILEDALEELAIQYEDELDSAASRVTRILEPLMLMFVACMVGSLVLAMYLPMFKAH